MIQRVLLLLSHMPKFPVYTSDSIIKLLKKKGFYEDHQTGSHKVFFHRVAKKRVIVPYHKKDLPIGTSKSILKMAGLL